MEDQIAEDVPVFQACLTDIQTQSAEVTSHITALTEKLRSGEYQVDGGMSFLDAKNHLLLEYLTNVTYVILLKVAGHDICSSAAVDRLVEIRTVLEKIRPINKKLQYQIDKLVKVTTHGVGVNGNSDPLSFKPNINMLASKEDGDAAADSASDDDDTTIPATDRGAGAPGVYVPPRVTAMPYQEDEGTGVDGAQGGVKSRKRALNSALLNDLRAEYSEEPEEIRDGYRSARRSAALERENERETFEEENMRRLVTTKHDRRNANVGESFDVSGGFAAFDVDGAGSDDDDGYQPPKQKKGKGKRFSSKGPKGKGAKAGNKFKKRK